MIRIVASFDEANPPLLCCDGADAWAFDAGDWDARCVGPVLDRFTVVNPPADGCGAESGDSSSLLVVAALLARVRRKSP